MSRLKLGIPKGSLQDSTVELFAKAGWRISVNSRSYYPGIDDPEIECMMVRAQEMARYVENGAIDAGLTGKDWILETGADVHEVAELIYSKTSLGRVRWVLAVAEDSTIPDRARPRRKSDRHRSRENDGTISARSTASSARVEFSWGATEVKVPQLADAIVEVTETGSSLRANHLRVVDTLLESATWFIANRKAWADPWKREKIENIVLLLDGAIKAYNARRPDAQRAPRRPRQSCRCAACAAQSHDFATERSDWLAINTIIEEKTVRQLIPKLKAAGAEGIVEYPLNKVVY